jgi:hypothetical protein
LSYGYGARSAAHGFAQEHLFGVENFVFFLQTLGAYVYLPSFLLIMAGLALLLTGTVTVFYREGVAAGLRRLVDSDALPPALLVLEGTLALASSQNKGSAFMAPLIPSMLILAAWGFLNLNKTRAWQFATTGFIVVVAVISLLPSLDLRLPLARPRLTELPLIGGIYVMDGRGTIQRYEGEGGYATANPVIPIDSATGREWVRVIADTSERLGKASGGSLPIAVGIRHYLYNTNAFHLARLLAGNTQLPLFRRPRGDAPCCRCR